MTYSASDFVDDCEQNCMTYEAPEVNASELEECEPDLYEGDGLRLIAERVARAMSQRRSLLAAAREALALLENPDSSAFEVEMTLSKAIQECAP
jgi:hypothetical protein